MGEEDGARRCKCKGSMGVAFCPLPPLCPDPVGWWEVVRLSQLAETRGPGDCCIPTCPTSLALPTLEGGVPYLTGQKGRKRSTR